MSESTKLYQVFKDLFEDGLEGLSESDISIDTVPNWDSLNHLRLMMSIEETFKIELSPDDFQNLTSFSELNSHIQKSI